MIRLQKILLPTDFSAGANEALYHALYLAQKYGAELHLLHVVVIHKDDPYNPAHHFPDDEEIHAKLRQLAQDRMTSTVADQATSEVTIRRVQRRDISAGPGIVAYAEEADIDLIVLNAHGQRGLARLLLGSVASEVVRTAKCPVLSIRERTAPHPLDANKKILIPVDFSEHATEAIRVGRHIAEIYDASLQLLHVLEQPLHPAFYNMGATSIKDLQPDIEDRAKKALRDAYAATRGPEVPVETHILEGRAAQQVPRFANDDGADLILISSHGLSGIPDYLLGNVAEKVLRHAQAPVLVVKAFGKSIVEDGS